MSESAMVRDSDGSRAVYRLSGFFDRAAAWALRESLEHETEPEVVLEFSLVREFSDLGIAVLANGIGRTAQRVTFRGLRQHQLRIFRYCGVAIDESAGRDALAPSDVVAGDRRVP